MRSENHTTAEYRAWHGMKTRCTNPNRPDWKNYGGRGITICERWANSYEAFLADMGRKPSPAYTLDRINNDGNYEPGNCRWTTWDLQSRNKRPRPRMVTVHCRLGYELRERIEELARAEDRSLSDWARRALRADAALRERQEGAAA
jgi:hypothetical protein